VEPRGGPCGPLTIRISNWRQGDQGVLEATRTGTYGNGCVTSGVASPGGPVRLGEGKTSPRLAGRSMGSESRGRGKIYSIRSTFEAPLTYAFAWCTHYTPSDGELSGEGFRRKILSRTRRKIVFEDLHDSPEGWQWSRYSVTLHPPDEWRAVAVGSHRTWHLVYTLRDRGDGTTEFRLRGERWPTEISKRNPPTRELERELRTMWAHYGRALERDFRSQAALRNRTSQ